MVQKEYIQRRKKTYYFRWVIPSDLRPYIGVVELKRSLSTSNYRAAFIRALPFFQIVEQIQQTRVDYYLGLSTKTDYGRELKTLRKELAVLNKRDVSSHLQSTRMFHDLLDEFYQLKVKNGLTQRMLKEYARYISAIKQLHPDICLQDVNKQNLSTLFTKYRGLPKRNLKPYKGKTVLELINMDVPNEHKVSDKTVSHVKKFLQGVFNHAVDTNQISRSPMAQLKLKLESKNRYGIYCDAELKALLELISGESAGWRKWVIPLAIYTGARRSELVQLRTCDIKRDDNTGIHFIIISADAGSVKTKASNRVVPIHSVLIKMGFLDFVSNQKGDRLFNGLKPEALSRWFLGLKVNNCFREVDNLGDSLTFHSFRHTFITKCRERNANMLALQQAVGHKLGSFSITDRYTHQVGLKVLKEAVETFVIS